MAKVILMYDGNKVISTKSKIDGDKFKKLVSENYKPICFASNYGIVGITTYPYNEKDHKTIFG